jgi:hypothetical protein
MYLSKIVFLFRGKSSNQSNHSNLVKGFPKIFRKLQKIFSRFPSMNSPAFHFAFGAAVTGECGQWKAAPSPQDISFGIFK